MLITPSLKKSFEVDQFQGNYINFELQIANKMSSARNES